MNEEIRCITNKGKLNEWKNNSNFLPPLHIVYKKLAHFLFHTLFANLFKQRYISSVTSYKVISLKTLVLGFLKILSLCA